MVAMTLSGCAYRAGNFDREMPMGYRAVAVPVFKNKSQEVGVEAYFTDAMVREIERGRIGRVTPRSEAQVTLIGSIEGIQYLANNTINSGLPAGTTYNTEYRVVVFLTIKLIRNSDSKVVWENNFKLERTYESPRVYTETLNSVNALYNNSARHELLQTMATDMTSEAHDRMTENF
jgi:hypothetical protein